MVSIYFNKKIYKRAAILQALKEFRKFIDGFTIKADSRYFRLKFNNISKEIRPIFKEEFSNYVLFLVMAK